MEPEVPKHPWLARLWVCIIMLVFSFIGLVVTSSNPEGGWTYWKFVVPIYAALALWLSWYLRRTKKMLSGVILRHEFLHWFALLASTFLVSRLQHLGVFSRFIAGLAVLLLIAQAFFMAGIYIETTFLFIGIAIGLFAWLLAYSVTLIYLYIFIPIIILIIAVVMWYLWYKKKAVR